MGDRDFLDSIGYGIVWSDASIFDFDFRGPGLVRSKIFANRSQDHLVLVRESQVIPSEFKLIGINGTVGHFLKCFLPMIRSFPQFDFRMGFKRSTMCYSTLRKCQLR